MSVLSETCWGTIILLEYHFDDYAGGPAGCQVRSDKEVYDRSHWVSSTVKQTTLAVAARAHLESQLIQKRMPRSKSSKDVGLYDQRSAVRRKVCVSFGITADPKESPAVQKLQRCRSMKRERILHSVCPEDYE